jgi:AraC family transcriptional regulator
MAPVYLMPSTTPSDGAAGHEILRARSRRYHWEGEGALSIKAFFAGRARYGAGQGRFVVDDRAYLVLNRGQRYAVTIEGDAPSESFCVFFAPGFADQVARGLTLSSAGLLDDPTASGPDPDFFERTYAHDDLISPVLLRLRAALARGERDQLWLTEQLHALMGRLLRRQGASLREAEQLPALRAATREEIYRRAHRARDYATALFDRPLGLDELAHAACLSPNHLLRSFRQVFGQTPHQYLTEVRLGEARRLLTETDRPVTEICLAIGFQSLGSFSWLFRRRVGVSPETYRRQFR